MTPSPAEVLELLRLAWTRMERVEMTPSTYSRKWVELLAAALRGSKHYGAPPFCVFDRDCGLNRQEFGVNELLFDILVAETTTISAVRGKELRAITRAEWIIESELDPVRSSQVLPDLNKLVVGQARNKMLVVSRNQHFQTWLAKLIPQLMGNDYARIFLAEIPPPGAPDRSSGVSPSLLDRGRLTPILP